MRATEKVLHQIIALLQNDLEVARERIAVLEGREWSRYEAGEHPVVAMPDPGPDPDDGFLYQYDDTGLVRSRVPAADLE